jgi:hypothetical protein
MTEMNSPPIHTNHAHQMMSEETHERIRKTSPVWWATVYGTVDDLKNAIKSKENVNATGGPHDTTLLFEAIKHGNDKTKKGCDKFDMLLKHCSLDMTPKNGIFKDTTLQELASKKGSVYMVEMLKREPQKRIDVLMKMAEETEIGALKTVGAVECLTKIENILQAEEARWNQEQEAHRIAGERYGYF